MENLIITEGDYENVFCGVLQVSKHCDWDTLANYIRERQRTDIQGLLGSCLFVDVLDNIYQDSYSDLLNGGTYTGCNGNKKIHYGLRTILAHYAYAAYAYRGGMVDTPYSFVIKQSEDSMPVPTGELRNIHDENRSIAFDYWKLTQEYLCANKETFTNYNGEDCCTCSCEDSCKPTGSRSHRTTKIKIIKR